jgi:hypothetical protein
MDKQDLIKVLVVIIAVLFLTEIFAFRGSIPFFGAGETSSVHNTTGTTTFSGNIRTYDPLLLLPRNTSTAIIDRLRMNDTVKDVQTESDGYLVDTVTRDDVFTLAAYLRSINVSSVSVANVVVPQILVVSTDNGTINASASGVVRIITDPILDVDNTVTVNMSVTVDDNGQLVSYNSPRIVTQDITGEFNASIVGLESKTYSYTIPWEGRTGLGNLSQFGAVDYNEVGSIVFKTPLSTSQVIQKKQLPYIVYIDSGSAKVEQSFTNTSLIAADFNDTNYTLPASALVITTNSSMEDPFLPYNATVSFTYLVMLQNPAYDFGSAPLAIETDKEYADNASVVLDISAVALGNKVILVKSVSIPS